MDILIIVAKVIGSFLLIGAGLATVMTMIEATITGWSFPPKNEPTEPVLERARSES